MYVAGNPMTEILFRTIDILQELQHDYFLCNGTLLGVIRDSELIPWDVDIDIGLSKTIDKDELATEFLDRGFAISDYGIGSDYLVLKFGDTKIDFNFFYPRGGEFITLWRIPSRVLAQRIFLAVLNRMRIPTGKFILFWTLEGYAFPIEDTLPSREISFLDRKVRVPLNPEAVLEYTYGQSWRIPNRNYDWQADGQNNARG